MKNSLSEGSKVAGLKSHGTLNPHPEKVIDRLFIEHDFFDARDSVQLKYEMLRRVRIEGVSVSQAAADFGLSRPSFYQAQEAFEQGGLSGLVSKKRGPRNAHKFSESVMRFLEETIAREGFLSAAKLVPKLKEQFQLTAHPRSIERALKRRKKKRVASS